MNLVDFITQFLDVRAARISVHTEFEDDAYITVETPDHDVTQYGPVSAKQADYVITGLVSTGDCYVDVKLSTGGWWNVDSTRMNRWLPWNEAQREARIDALLKGLPNGPLAKHVL